MINYIALEVQYLSVCSQEGDDSEEVEDGLYLQHAVQGGCYQGWIGLDLQHRYLARYQSCQ